MKYIDIVKEAKDHGQWQEKTMWISVEHVSEMLEEIKDSHPDMYWAFMRKEAGIMSGYHYNEKWATHDVSKLEWTDREGKKRHGAYWTVEQVEDATKAMSFPAGVTKWDKFVAFNVMHSDTCKVLDDDKILKAAYEFFFKDEDFSNGSSGASPTKTWHYMCCKYAM